MKMPVLGFRFGDFTYITDANRIDDSEKEKIRGSHRSSSMPCVMKNTLSFFPSEAIAEVEQLGVPEAWFTHISHQLGRHADIEPDPPRQPASGL
jgi:phosphoribosyl 1,2-cyclic phosphate phosphodiesterase